MRKKFNVFLTLLLALVVQITFAQEKSITGVVTDAADGSPMVGANVVVKGTNKGAATDFDGKYSIKANVGDVLVFSNVGYADVTRTVGASNTINVVMKEGEGIGTVVIVGQKGLKLKPKEVTYAQQVVKAKELTMGKDNNLKTALQGKVAGVQVAAQAGAKLGKSGAVYLRGGLGLTGRHEALYIVDGIEMNPDNIDMDNVASTNVLKGPSAVSLYGLRGANGVILITTKRGKKGKINIELFNNTTFDQVAYLPKYQNEYGQGHSGDADFRTYSYNAATDPAAWQSLDGVRYNWRPYYDESWGPKFDGQDYAPWYAWWPGKNNENPYYAKTQKWSGSPDNILNFYDKGVNSKTGFAISGGTESTRARVSYSRIDQKGLMPFSDLGKDLISANFDVNLTKKLKIGTNVSYSSQSVHGNFSNGSDFYGNMATGSFNQWFGRDIETDKLRELKDLEQTNGYVASWNWGGPRLWRNDHQKSIYWQNPYFNLENDSYDRTDSRMAGSLDINYEVTDKFSVSGKAMLYKYNNAYLRKTPYIIQYNNPEFATPIWNSMSKQDYGTTSVEYRVMGDYKHDFNKDLKMNIIVGAETRDFNQEGLGTYMTKETTNPNSGFVIPDVYLFSNSKEKLASQPIKSEFKRRDIFSRVKFGYKDYLFFTGDVTNVWDSRYDLKDQANKNSFLYGSAGISFIFTEALKLKSKFLDYGKIRASYAEVGSLVGAYGLNPSYNLSSTNSYKGNPAMFTPSTASNPGIHPATSSQFEIGTDLKMLKNRLKLSVTYYTGHKTEEIMSSTVSYSSGYYSLLMNAGDMLQEGIEIEIGATPFKKKNGLRWDVAFNWSNPSSTILELAPGQDSHLVSYDQAFGVISMVNKKKDDNNDGKFGQLIGTAIKRDENGNPILDSDGLYLRETNHSFGSVLPDFVGGFINTLNYKGFTLSGNITFQQGGKFFSLTEWWGDYSGLMAETAGNNDKGKPKRDDVSDGGGVHVVGVDESGNSVDRYVDAMSYYRQNYPDMAEGFVHDASYIKLAEISLSYKFPKNILGKYIKGASVGIVARNLGMISVAADNTHGWDPSELGRQWGESSQLPGTRNIGFNIHLTL